MPRSQNCPQCGGSLQLGIAHRCPANFRPLDWKWAAGIIFALLLQLAAFLYSYGQLKAVVEANKKGIERIEKLYIK